MSRKNTGAMPSLVGKAGAILVIALLGAACLLSTANRASLPLPAGLSCSLPTHRSCIKSLVDRSEVQITDELVEDGLDLARSAPANASAQALAAAFLADKGRHDEADFFYYNSARLGWRERTGQIFSYLAAIEEGRAEVAILHLDALLKLERDFVNNPQLMQPMLNDPEVRAYFATKLAARPAYLNQFLRTFGVDTETAWDDRLALMEEARAKGLELTGGDVGFSAWENLRKDPAKAVDYWAALMGPGEWGSGNLAWSSSPDRFDPASPAGPFVWHFVEEGVNLLRVGELDGAAALETKRSSNVPAGRVARIFIRIMPGRYPISWRNRGEPTALYPNVSCAAGGEAAVSVTSRSPEGKSNGVLDVKAGCQILALWIQKRGGSVEHDTAIGDIDIGGLPILR